MRKLFKPAFDTVDHFGDTGVQRVLYIALGIVVLIVTYIGLIPLTIYHWFKGDLVEWGDHLSETAKNGKAKWG